MSGKSLGAASNTPESKKDNWNTPWHAVRDAEALLGQSFMQDACACDKATAKAPMFITPEQDSLKTEWIVGPVWCNPPFSRKTEFLQRAHEQAIKHSIIVCMMLPYEPCTKWWREHVSGKASIIYVPDGRYNYCDPATKAEITGVNFASCFVVFTPLTMPTQVVDFDRGIGSAQ